MGKQKSNTARTTVYRLAGLPDLASGLRQKYKDAESFTTTAVRIEERDAILMTGSVQTDLASWAGRLSSLSGVTITEGNMTAAAALLIINGDGGAWALTYGMGHQLLDHAFVEPGFGHRIAVRSIDPESLRSITRTTLDHRSRTDRSSIPSGEHWRGFGVGDFGEMVSRLVGKAKIPGLTVGDVPLEIRGADALSLPLGGVATSLIADLDVLDELLKKDPLPELQALEQLMPVKASAITVVLDNELEQALSARGVGKRLGLSWPHERIDENGTASQHRYAGIGRNPDADGLPTLDALLDVLHTKNAADLVGSARAVKIQLLRDKDEPMSKMIPLIDWLAFEVDLEGKRYCLHDGRWYLMDESYAEKLQQRVKSIFDRDPGVALPRWTSDLAEEKDYNIMAAGLLGATHLDRTRLVTEQHPGGIEPCDILSRDGIHIHVKNLDRSSSASHLIAQALVAVDSLRFDGEARTKLGELVAARGGDRTLVEKRPERVVLGMARKDHVTPEGLFTFTQVTLARLDAVLSSVGITVAIAPIERK